MIKNSNVKYLETIELKNKRIQEQDANIEELEKRIEEQNKRIEDLKRTITNESIIQKKIEDICGSLKAFKQVDSPSKGEVGKTAIFSKKDPKTQLDVEKCKKCKELEEENERLKKKIKDKKAKEEKNDYQKEIEKLKAENASLKKTIEKNDNKSQILVEANQELEEKKSKRESKEITELTRVNEDYKNQLSTYSKKLEEYLVIINSFKALKADDIKDMYRYLGRLNGKVLKEIE